jgi:phosphohistidine swiveling domain-containing protein
MLRSCTLVIYKKPPNNDMAKDYSKMTIEELEREISDIYENEEDRPDALTRAVIFMGQLDFAKHIYHDKKRSPYTRLYKEGSKDAEILSFSQALGQLLLLMRTRGIDFGKVFGYSLEHLKDKEWKDRNEKPKTEIRGLPAFRGNVRGTAYVVSERNPISRAPKGSVLIMQHADSEISHMIKDFSAVVSDQGGRLCHLAIVAREMKIPAIVGTGNATNFIKSGDIVEIDGNSGRVKVIR